MSFGVDYDIYGQFFAMCPQELHISRDSVGDLFQGLVQYCAILRQIYSGHRILLKLFKV